MRSTYFRVKHTLQRSDFELAPKASGRLTARCTRLVFTACSPKCSQFNKYSCCFGDGNAYWNSHYLLLLCKHSLWPLRCNYVMKFHCIHVYCPYDGILSWAVNENPFSHMLVWHIWWRKNGNVIEVMCVCPLTQHHGAAQRYCLIPRFLPLQNKCESLGTRLPDALSWQIFQYVGHSGSPHDHWPGYVVMKRW